MPLNSHTLTQIGPLNGNGLSNSNGRALDDYYPLAGRRRNNEAELKGNNVPAHYFGRSHSTDAETSINKRWHLRRRAASRLNQPNYSNSNSEERTQRPSESVSQPDDDRSSPNDSTKTAATGSGTGRELANEIDPTNGRGTSASGSNEATKWAEAEQQQQQQTSAKTLHNKLKNSDEYEDGDGDESEGQDDNDDDNGTEQAIDRQSTVCALDERQLPAFKRDQLCYWFPIDKQLSRKINGSLTSSSKSGVHRLERLLEAELHLFKLLPDCCDPLQADENGHENGYVNGRPQQSSKNKNSSSNDNDDNNQSTAQTESEVS